MSAVTQAGRLWSKMWSGGCLWNRVAIAFRFKVVSTSGLKSAILNFGGWLMSGNVGSGTGTSGVVENMKVVFEILVISHTIPEKPCTPGLAVVFETNPLGAGHVTMS